MKARIILEVEVDDRQGAELIARMREGRLPVQLHTRGLLPVLLAEGTVQFVNWSDNLDALRHFTGRNRQLELGLGEGVTFPPNL